AVGGEHHRDEEASRPQAGEPLHDQLVGRADSENLNLVEVDPDRRLVRGVEFVEETLSQQPGPATIRDDRIGRGEDDPAVLIEGARCPSEDHHVTRARIGGQTLTSARTSTFY